MAVLRSHSVQPRGVGGVDGTWEAMSRDLALAWKEREHEEGGLGGRSGSHLRRRGGKESGRRNEPNKGLSAGVNSQKKGTLGQTGVG